MADASELLLAAEIRETRLLPEEGFVFQTGFTPVDPRDEDVLALNAALLLRPGETVADSSTVTSPSADVTLGAVTVTSPRIFIEKLPGGQPGTYPLIVRLVTSTGRVLNRTVPLAIALR